ncbi:oligoendopeptidase F [Gorillibacterium timonense]|uniref:oligoendopeptidase F n=1 Tax=Gorillibacterium timonense TaxID=1689269 RepID=UPI00071C8684|nr:oligoendopeptidase F [Gorillibacterium timonense]
MKERLKRADAPIQATWNLGVIFDSWEKWDAELKALKAELDSVTQYKGRLSDGPDALIGCLEALEAYQIRLNQAAAFSRLHLSEDGTNPDYQAKSAAMGDLGAEAAAAFSFVRSEILDIPDDQLERWMEESSGLASFRKSLSELLRARPYQLSAQTEEALAGLSEVLGAPQAIYSRSKLSDMTFAPVEDGEGHVHPVSFATFETDFELSADPTLRHHAYASFSSTLRQYRNTFAAVYATEVKKQVVLSRMRGYESVTHMLLQPQQATLGMYRAILDTIFQELAPHMRRYARLKQRVLGLPSMTYCDLKAPLDPAYSPPVSFEEAGKTVREALTVMGSEYAAIIDDMLDNRRIDYTDNIGKSTGAFCSSTFGLPSFILMTWSGSMRSAFTLAHELGHAGHLTLAARHQRQSNCRPTMYFIEAPSTMNELLLADHMRKQSEDSRFKRMVIQSLLNTYYHNFVTHLLEGEYQRRVYAAAEAGEAITATKLSGLMGKVLEEFWGDAVALDEDASLTWMRQPHYYRGLYPYTYAAGLTASTAVAAMIREEGQPAVDRWLTVLRAGGSLAPLELMKLAGVDMEDAAPIRKAVEYVGQLVTELEDLFE